MNTTYSYQFIETCIFIFIIIVVIVVIVVIRGIGTRIPIK